MFYVIPAAALKLVTIVDRVQCLTSSVDSPPIRLKYYLKLLGPSCSCTRQEGVLLDASVKGKARAKSWR